MELLAEFFESDLLYIGIGIALFSALLPWKNAKRNYSITAICLTLYAIAELTVSVLTTNNLAVILSLFLGSIALSAAVGRIAKLIWLKLKKK